MGSEHEPGKEGIGRGQLYLLSHAGSELFTGYGLTTEAGRKDRLVGLLMVDRPFPVNRAWLQEIEEVYGRYTLLPMTQNGDYGLVTQMRIAPESLPLLQRPAHPSLPKLEQALQPLLEELPTVVLKLRWDDEQQAWQSEFWFGLPPQMQAVFEQQGYGCFAAERADQTVAFITHASDADIAQFEDAPVLYEWQYVAMPTAPLIRYRAAILDDPTAPYVFEHYLNVADPDQARCLSHLVKQAELSLDFYGEEFEYRYSKLVAHPAEMRQGLEVRVRQAIEYYGEIPPERRDFDRAKTEFQRTFPL